MRDLAQYSSLAYSFLVEHKLAGLKQVGLDARLKCLHSHLGIAGLAPVMTTFFGVPQRLDAEDLGRSTGIITR